MKNLKAGQMGFKRSESRVEQVRKRKEGKGGGGVKEKEEKEVKQVE